MLERKIKEPVKVRKKTLSNGTVSLYLDLYYNKHREYEFLKLYLIPEKCKTDRDRNKETMALANTIKAQRIIEIQTGRFGLKKENKKNVLFYEYFKTIAENKKKSHTEGTYMIWMICFKHLKKYDSRQSLTFSDITPEWIRGFYNYLDKDAEAYAIDERNRNDQRMLSQNSKYLYFSKLQTCLRQALADNIIQRNPMTGISGFSKEESLREYLTLEEIKKMAATYCEYPEIKRVFLFSCLTGLRRSDIKKLTWGEVSYFNGRIRLIFKQKKTGGLEYLDISNQAGNIIGKRGSAKPTDFVFGDFRHPSKTNECLRIWAAKAGINKHISFHVARHTFAVLMLTIGTDLYTVSKLLGHKDITTTEIYAKIVDSKKQEAVDRIPKIF